MKVSILSSRFTSGLVLLALTLIVMVSLTACGAPTSAAAQNAQVSTSVVVGGQSESPELKSLSQDFQPTAPSVQAEVLPSDQEDPAQAIAQEPPAVEIASTTEPTLPPQPVEAPTAEPAQVDAIAAPAEQAAQPNLEVKPEVGFQAPDFTLQTLDGQTIRLSELRGQPVVLSYWASWCGPCKQELPVLNQLKQEYDTTGIQVITINAIEQDTVDKVQDTISQLGVGLPVLLDQQDQFHNSYSQLFFPTSYFIDANGVIRFIKLGSASETELRSTVEKLINNQL